MSELSIAARAKAREKVERLTRSPKGDVDASGWREPLGEQGMAPGLQTGPRPVSRRQFKRGGKVHGEAESHMGRKPRASGGMTASEYINRNVKDANEDREGPKHLGGMKKGGRAHKATGGNMTNLALPSAFTPVVRASGGRTNDKASKAAQNLAQSAMKMTAKQGSDPYDSQPAQAKNYRSLWALKGGRPNRAEGGRTHGPQCRCPKCGGGAVYKASGGEVRRPRATGGPVSYGGSRPVGGRIARAKGGRAKKAMNVNIIIAPAAGAQKPAMPPPGMAPPGGPIGMHQGAPPPPPPMMPGGPPPAGAGMPPLPRKSGGRAYPIETGGGGGLARLDKARAYGG